jgi:S1-C subfamily serine protease
MRHRASASLLGTAFALLLLPAALAAQTGGPTPGASRPAGCRGINGESSSINLVGRGGQPVSFPSYTTVADVHKDSPAEAAGIQPGDVLIAQDGRDLVGSPPRQPRLAGDTVQLVVLRGDREVPLTLVFGRWDPPEGETRACVRVDPASSGS